MWRVIFLIVSLNMLIACTKTEDYLRDVVIKHSDLVDPSSAIFRNITFDGLVGNTWCGEINVKNGMGGYTGWKPFHLLIFKDGTVSFSLLQLLEDESDENEEHYERNKERSERNKRINGLTIKIHEGFCKDGQPTSEWTPFWNT
jgi:hypothetical protein